MSFFIGALMHKRRNRGPPLNQAVALSEDTPQSSESSVRDEMSSRTRRDDGQDGEEGEGGGQEEDDDEEEEEEEEEEDNDADEEEEEGPKHIATGMVAPEDLGNAPHASTNGHPDPQSTDEVAEQADEKGIDERPKPSPEEFAKLTKFKSFMLPDNNIKVHLGEDIFLRPAEGDSEDVDVDVKIPEDDLYLAKVREIRAKGSDYVWLKVAYYYKYDDMSGQNAVRVCREAKEVAYSNHEQIVDVRTFDGVADVVQFDEMSEDAEEPNPSYWWRYTYNAVGRRYDRNQPPHPTGFYDPLQDRMVYCPRPGCKTWWHQGYLAFKGSVRPSRKRDLLAFELAGVYEPEEQDVRLTYVGHPDFDKLDEDPASGEDRPSKKARLSTDTTTEEAPSSTKAQADNTDGAQSPYEGLFPDSADVYQHAPGGPLPTELLQLARSSITRGGWIYSSTKPGEAVRVRVAGNIAKVFRARELVNDVVNGIARGKKGSGLRKNWRKSLGIDEWIDELEGERRRKESRAPPPVAGDSTSAPSEGGENGHAPAAQQQEGERAALNGSGDGTSSMKRASSRLRNLAALSPVRRTPTRSAKVAAVAALQSPLRPRSGSGAGKRDRCDATGGSGEGRGASNDVVFSSPQRKGRQKGKRKNWQVENQASKLGWVFQDDEGRWQKAEGCVWTCPNCGGVI